MAAGGEELPETIRAKATQDAAALLRSVANQRDRNSEALEKTITEAASYSEAEALELDILDLLANDVPDLLDKLDGMEVSVQGSAVTLETGNLGIRRAEETPVQKVLRFLANPTLVFILIAAGGNPGTVRDSDTRRLGSRNPGRWAADSGLPGAGQPARELDRVGSHRRGSCSVLHRVAGAGLGRLRTGGRNQLHPGRILPVRRQQRSRPARAGRESRVRRSGRDGGVHGGQPGGTVVFLAQGQGR